MDPAKDEVFLWWIVDRVKELARDPQFIRDFEEWQAKREKACTGSLTGVSTGSG